jgi:hypothetical protein
MHNETQKEISQYTLGEKIGFIMATMEKMDSKLDKSIEESCKRLCDCEIKLDAHDRTIAEAQGKMSIIGIIWGSIWTVISSVVIWLITTNK